jgi:hypothetical protein
MSAGYCFTLNAVQAAGSLDINVAELDVSFAQVSWSNHVYVGTAKYTDYRPEQISDEELDSILEVGL